VNPPQKPPFDFGVTVFGVENGTWITSETGVSVETARVAVAGRVGDGLAVIVEVAVGVYVAVGVNVRVKTGGGGVFVGFGFCLGSGFVLDPPSQGGRPGSPHVGAGVGLQF